MRCRHTNVVIILCLLLSPLTSQGQTYIFGRTDLVVGPGAFSAASGDFNGDGVIDLVSVNQGANTASVVLGNLDGGFNPQVTYATGTAPTAVIAADFNHDGNLDLAVTNGNCSYSGIAGAINLSCSAGSVSLLLGNGDGSFQPHLDYATGKNPSALVAGDFNGDGNLDLAIVNAQDETVSVLLGQGDGTFQAQALYTVRGAQNLLVGDFNNDHKLDLAVEGGPLSTLLGNGDGTFQAPLINATYLETPGLASADFNRDGNLDVYAAGDLFLGNGDGTFVLHSTSNGPAVGADAAADLNGDGNPDLVLVQSGKLSVLLGNGDGSFQNTVNYALGPFATDVIATDLNGDGRLDLAVAGPGCTSYDCAAVTSATVSVLLGLGDGTFVGGTNYAFQSVYPPLAVVSADFNGDGKADIAAETTFVPAGQTAPIGVYLGNGDGTLQLEVPTSLPQSAGNFAAADLNGDGKADIATVYVNCTEGNNTCTPGQAAVLIGNGDGTFQPPVAYTAGLEPETLTIADLNGDTNPDLAVGNYGSNTVSVLLGKGDGTFQSHVDYAAGAGPTTIVAGDFNGDGKLDLVVQIEGGFSLLAGNGDGTFRTHQDHALNDQLTSLAAGDFNGDGKLDLVLISEDMNQFFILLGNGDGTFQTIVNGAGVLLSGFTSLSGFPSVGDFNGDGKLDLAIGAQNNEIGSILLGKGDGTFYPPEAMFLGSGLLAVNDLNQDGLPDLIATTGYASPAPAISVLLSTPFKAVSPSSLDFGSQGDGTTSAPQTITLSNPSNVGIAIANVVASGDFSQSNDCGTSLAPGAHCAMTVTFLPTVTGSETGSITLTDSTRISPLAIPLSGTGVNGPALTAYPFRVNFAPQATGTTSAAFSVMLVNGGNSVLNLTGISLAGSDSSDFAQTNNCGATLAAGSGCVVSVTFHPGAAGSRTAAIAITGTEPGGPLAVDLSGTGLGAGATFSPTQLTFGSQAAGTTSSAQSATLTNTGNAALNTTAISATGDFAETNSCGTSLAAHSSCQISVSFAPTAAGNLTGTIALAGSQQAIALVGVGAAAPDFAVAPASGSQTSQTVSAGQNAQFSLAVTPAGSFTGAVSLSCGVTPAATPAPTCGLSSSSLQLGSSGAQTVTVTIKTAAPVTSHRDFPAMPLAWAAMLLGAGLLPGKRRWFLFALTAIFVVGSGIGCGGGQSSSTPPPNAPPPTTTPGTPSGSYTATITATSGNLSHATTVTVIVQ